MTLRTFTRVYAQLCSQLCSQFCGHRGRKFSSFKTKSIESVVYCTCFMLFQTFVRLCLMFLYDRGTEAIYHV